MKSRVFVTAFIVVFLFSCGHIQKKGDMSIDEKCSEEIADLYFSDWEAALECSEKIASGERSEEEKQIADFILGENNFLKHNDKEALQNFLNALKGPDATITEVALKYIKTIYLDLGSINRIINFETDDISNVHVRMKIDIERLKWALALDRKSVYEKILDRITFPGDLSLKITEKDQSVKTVFSKSFLDSSVKKVFPDMSGKVDVQDYFTDVYGKTFYFVGDVHIPNETELSVITRTQMRSEIYVDSFKIDPDTSFVLSKGNHRIAVKIIPEKERDTGIGVYLPFYNSSTDSAEKGYPDGTYSFIEEEKEEKTLFFRYVELLNNEKTTADDFFKLYSSIMGSFSTPFIYNLAVRSLEERSVERGLNYLKRILDKDDLLRPKLKIMEWLLYSGRKKELRFFEKKFPIDENNFHAMLFKLDRYSFQKQYLAGLILSKKLYDNYKDHPVAHYYLASAYEDLAYYSRAFKVRSDLLKKIPYHLPLLSSAGTIAGRLEKLDVVEKLLKRRIQRAPHDISLRYKLAENSFKKGEYEIADSIYDKILTVLKNDNAALLGKGDVAYINGKKNVASKYYSKAFLLYPESNEASKKASLFRRTDFDEYFKKYSKSDDEILKIAKNYKEDRSVPYTVVYDGGHYRFVNHNLIIAKFRMLIKINSKEGAVEFAEKEYSGELLNAVIIRDGKIIKVQKKEDGNILDLSGLKQGDFLDYTVKTEEKNDYWLKGFNDLWVFGQFGVPYITSRVTLFVPEDVKLNYFTSKGVKEPEMFKEKGGTVYLFSKSETFLPPKEKNTPHKYEVVPTLQFSIINSWAEFAKWQSRFIKEGSELARTVEEKTFSLIGEKDNPMQKIEKLRDFVARKIRYRSLDPGELRVRPENAQKTLKRMTGDCKDKVLLLKTMLKAAGINSRYALIRTKYAGPFFKKVPSMQFDHALLYIPSQKELRTEGFFIDPTAGFDSYLGLGSALVGVESMVIDEYESSYEFIEVQENKIGKVDILLKDSEPSSAVFTGTSATKLRFDHAKGKSLDKCLGVFFNNKDGKTGEISDVEINSGKLTDPLVLGFNYKGVFPSIVSNIYGDVVNGSERYYPYVLPYLFQKITFTLKTNEKISFSQKNRFFNYSVKNEGDGVLKVDFVVKKWTIKSEEFAELEKYVINMMMFEKQMTEKTDG